MENSTIEFKVEEGCEHDWKGCIPDKRLLDLVDDMTQYTWSTCLKCNAIMASPIGET